MGDMGRIIVTIPGPWSKPPALESSLDLAFGPAAPALVDEFAAVGRRAGVLTDADLRRLRKHRGIVQATAEFDAPGDMSRARQAARLARQAFEAGAYGVYVETAPKVYTPGALEGLDPEDPAVLLHFFVEVLGDDREIAAEGLQAFDLPDVVVPYAGRAEAGPAQGAAFALAAKMVCDGFRPVEGGTFRASESAPEYRVAHRGPPADADPDDPYVNPRGAWVLSR